MVGERQQRRLAAIFAADVVGYGRLVETDEAGMMARLNALRGELMDPAIERHHWRVAKLRSDVTLVEFRSIVDAVQ